MDRKIGLGSNGVLTSKDDQPQATVLRHEWDVPRMIAAYGLLRASAPNKSGRGRCGFRTCF